MINKILISLIACVFLTGQAMADHETDRPRPVPFMEVPQGVSACMPYDEAINTYFHLGFKQVQTNASGTALYHAKTGNWIFAVGDPKTREFCLVAFGNPEIVE